MPKFEVLVLTRVFVETAGKIAAVQEVNALALCAEKATDLVPVIDKTVIKIRHLKDETVPEDLT